MTHDELLDRIAQKGLEPHGNVMPTHLVLALRAVVELHKPIEGHEHLCGGCWFGDGMMAYPCPTIQVIEKELQ
jgi:hypothetical protein